MITRVKQNAVKCAEEGFVSDSQLNFIVPLNKGIPYSEREKNFVLNNLEFSNRDIANRICRTEASVRQFLNDMGIHRSKFQLARIKKRTGLKIKGENNPNWKNGISKNPYINKKKRALLDREKNAARAKVYRAIRSGELIPQACEVCRATKNIEAHHLDYSKPLEVQWLCREHHIIADKQRRSIEQNQSNWAWGR